METWTNAAGTRLDDGRKRRINENRISLTDPLHRDQFPDPPAQDRIIQNVVPRQGRLTQ
jgi:hypothetical protein